MEINYHVSGGQFLAEFDNDEALVVEPNQLNPRFREFENIQFTVNFCWEQVYEIARVACNLGLPRRSHCIYLVAPENLQTIRHSNVF